MSKIAIIIIIFLACSTNNITSIAYIESSTKDTVKKYNSNKVLESATVIDKDSNVICKIQYYSSGQVKSVEPYKNNLLEGTYQSFFSDGTKECFIQFMKGEKNGHYLCKTEDFYLYTYFVGDNRKVLCKYDEQGNVIFYEVYTGNKVEELPTGSVSDSLNFKRIKLLYD